MTTTEAKGKPSGKERTEGQAGTKRFWLIRMSILLLIASIVLAVMQWGLHKIKIEGLKAINEQTISGFEDEQFEVPEDTVTYRTEGSKEGDQRIFVTYTKYNPITGQTYAGHSKGYGTPEAIVKARDRYHHRNGEGFLPAVLDKFSDEFVEIKAEIFYLQRRFEIYYEYMKGYYKPQHKSSLWLLEETSKMMLGFYENKKLSDMRSLTKEINVCIREELPHRNAMELRRLFQKHLGEDIEAEEKKYLDKIAKIQKRGKIKTENEYRLIETRLDELFAENPDSQEWQELDKLLGTYNVTG